MYTAICGQKFITIKYIKICNTHLFDWVFGEGKGIVEDDWMLIASNCPTI